MQCILAVDAGNTKTIALVASLDGTILGTGRGECGDIYNSFGAPIRGSSTVDQALAHVEYAVLQALEVAHVSPSDLVAGVFNMAGADWPEDYALLESAMRKHGFGQTILVQNDALGVLHAATADNVGVSIVCGTGTATGARGPDGRIWHSSFWQLDAGGATTLGQRMLRAVFRSQLGLEPATALKEHVLDYYGLSTLEEVLHAMTCREHERLALPPVAGLAPLLLDAAAQGDCVAQRIVREQGHAMGDYADVAAQRVGIEGTAFTLVLAGGVLRHPSSLLSEAIIERVHTHSPEVHTTRSRFEPVIGVLFTALETAQVTLDDPVRNRVISTIPDMTLFETVRR